MQKNISKATAISSEQCFRPYLSIISCVYHEQPEDIRCHIDKLHDEVTGIPFEHIIIYHPLASNELREYLHSGNFRAYEQTRFPGVGNAYREGFEHAVGDYILMYDPDGEMDPSVARQMYDEMMLGADVVCANRTSFDGYKPTKLILNKCYNAIFKRAYGLRIDDISYCYKMIDASIAKSISWTAERQDIGAEVALYPAALGYKLTQVPVAWRARGAESPTTLGLLQCLRYVRPALIGLIEKHGYLGILSRNT